MDMDTQRVWDYASDGYVHRIVQNKADGKLVQLDPGSIVYEPTDEDDPASIQYTNGNSGNGDDFDDYVPRSKLTNVGLEYTHLLTSQLDSQRTYFESLLDSAADKASLASTSAAKAEAITSSAQKELETLRIDHDNLIQHAVPNLQKELARSQRRGDKFEGMARKLEKEWREEKALGGSLMERVEHLVQENEGLKKEKADLEEQNRDLSFFITGGEKLRGIQGELGEELREGTMEVGPAAAEEGKGKKKRGKAGKK